MTGLTFMTWEAAHAWHCLKGQELEARWPRVLRETQTTLVQKKSQWNNYYWHSAVLVVQLSSVRISPASVGNRQSNIMCCSGNTEEVGKERSYWFRIFSCWKMFNTYYNPLSHIYIYVYTHTLTICKITWAKSSHLFILVFKKSSVLITSFHNAKDQRLLSSI